MAEALAEAVRRYPPPFVVGWSAFEGRCHVEVTRRISYARFWRRQWAGGTWAEVMGAVGHG